VSASLFASFVYFDASLAIPFIMGIKIAMNMIIMIMGIIMPNMAVQSFWSL